MIHGNTFYENRVNVGSIWVDTTSTLIVSGPRTGLILQNLGSSDVTISFGSAVDSDVGIKFEMGTIYEMPEYFLYAGSITGVTKTGSGLMSYIEGI